VGTGHAGIEGNREEKDPYNACMLDVLVPGTLSVYLSNENRVEQRLLRAIK